MWLRTIFFIVLSSCIAIGTSGYAASDTDETQPRGASRVEQTSNDLTGDKFAIVVGIDQYSTYSGLSSLNYAVADAKALADVLEADGYQVLRRFNADANRRFILDSIDTVKQMAELSDRSDSTLLFSFSGHGFAANGENYLVTQDASRDELFETGLAISDVQRALRETGIARRMIFIDACRNDPHPNAKSTGAESFVDQHKGEGEAILFSTRAGEFSYESSQLGQGVFSYFLVKGLAGEAVSDGSVSLQGLKTYLEKNVRFWTGKHIGKVQTPYVSGEYTGSFPLISKVVRPEPNVVKPDPVVAVTPPPDQTSVQGAVPSENVKPPKPVRKPQSILIKSGKGTEFLVRSLEDLFDIHDMTAGTDRGGIDESTALKLHTTERGIYLEDQFGNLVVRGEVSVKLTGVNGKTLQRETFVIDGSAPVHVDEAEARAAQGFANQFESSSIMRAIEDALVN